MDETRHGRHRAGGRHSDTLQSAHLNHYSPDAPARRGRHAAEPAAVPPLPPRAPLLYQPLPAGPDSPLNLGPLSSVTDLIPVEVFDDEKPAAPRPLLRRSRPARLAAAVTTGGILIIGAGGVGAASAGHKVTRESISRPVTEVLPRIEADPGAKLKRDRVDVGTTPAPPPPPPAPEPVVEAAPPAPVPAPAPPRVIEPPAPVAPPAPAPDPAWGAKAPVIAAAARAQLGRIQDCTMLVTNALAAVGINFHDWPAGYFKLGVQIAPGEAVPGDLVYYANGGTGLAHIAVYDGNGMAIHGGFNGNQTVRFSALVGSGPVYIRVA